MSKDVTLKAAPATIYQRFVKQVESSPDHPAVVIAQQQVSYFELYQLTQRLAGLIEQHCPAAGQRVALYFEPGVEVIAAMLATIRIGRTFTCLDIDDPTPRLQHILEDCSASMLLTDAANAASARRLAGDQFPVIESCEAATVVADSAVTEPISSVPMPEVSYLLYTSGSTGKPKGVCQTDSNLQHYINCYVERVGISAADRLTWLFSTSFAASLIDIFSALLNGATLFPYNIRRQGLQNIGHWVETHQISILHMVPSVFRHLMKVPGSKKKLASVKAVDLGGETLFGSDLTLFQQHFLPGTRFFNHYAASELSVICQLDIISNCAPGDAMLPAGQPANGIELSIHDSAIRPVPTGTIGEIKIHSRYLSPGYWQQAELTANSFEDDPERPGWRIYHTGDLGCIDEQGRLSVVGRNGSRVKIHGHSIDIQEVEGALSQLGLARELAVVAVGDQQDRLAACLAGVTPEHQQETVVRRALSDKLPRYMLPTYVRFFDSLPKTATGKVDRRALQQLQWQQHLTHKAMDSTYSDHADAEPLTVVINLFQQHLANNAISPADDFFLLGGDSLAFTDLFAELEKRYRVTLDLTQVMSSPTAQKLADAVIQARQNNKQQPYPQLIQAKAGSGLPVFFVHGAGGFLFTSPEFQANLGDHPLYTYQARGLDGVNKPHNSIREMATDYIEELRKIQPAGPYLLGGTCSGSIAALEMANQLNRAGESVAALIMLDPPLHRHGKGLTHLLRLAKGYASLTRHWYRTWIDNAARKQKAHDRLGERLVTDATGKKLNQVDTEKVSMALRTHHQLKRNLLLYQLPRYNGAVAIIATGARMRQRYDDLGLSGTIRTYFAGQSHHQFTKNPEFIPALRNCMQDIETTLNDRGR